MRPVSYTHLDVYKRQLFLSVKPQVARGVLEKLAPALTNQLVISIRGGVTIAFLEQFYKDVYKRQR